MNPDSNFIETADQFVQAAEQAVQQVDLATIGGWFNLVRFFQSSPVRIFGSVIIFLCIVGLVYLSIRLWEMRQAEKERFYHYFHRQAPETPPANDRWQQVVQLFSSPNSSDWRIAIIEADAMLEDLINRLGYRGDSLGEKMKQITPQNFPAIQQAWEAHKIRNRIAHEGMNFNLSREDANYAFHMYQQVFRDARFI